MQKAIEILDNGDVKITLPVLFRMAGRRRQLILPGETSAAEAREPLALAVARGFRWQQLIDDGKFPNAQALAHALGRDAAKVAGTLRFAQLAPAVIHRLLAGDYPPSVTLEKLRQQQPVKWDEQYASLFPEK